LVVSNHVSVADPLIIVGSCPRPLAFMAKEELFRGWYARLAARLTGGAFPVRRGQNDVRAVRVALELIRGGSAVMLFPEGTRHPEGLGPALPGISYLATRSECPVLPVAVVGSEAVRRVTHLMARPSIEVRFGEPFVVTERDGDAPSIAGQIMQHIAALLPPDRRGVYGSSREAVHAN
jgi:1-acyl-sn-glycerol-3-phosphate acyltransferase